jgi:general secretion pathway protein G
MARLRDPKGSLLQQKPALQDRRQDSFAVFAIAVPASSELRYPKMVNRLACLMARPLAEARARGKGTVPLGGRRGRRNGLQGGMTLLELIIASFVLLILASAALPVVRVTMVRSKEEQLHKALREIRNAIDRYKDYADLHLIRVEVGSEGYPPDLDTLVKPVEIGPTRKVRFLRRIPVDPMTGRADWNLQSIQDDADSTSWGGSNVFDVHSKSQGTALDGTRYADW